MKASHVAAAHFLAATPAFPGVVSTSDTGLAKRWISVKSGVNVIDVASSTVPTLERLGNPVVSCYNQGTADTRLFLATAIDNFCNNWLIGQTVSPGHEYWQHYFYGNNQNVYLSLNMFTPFPCGSSVVDGACNVNLRMPFDQCNTDGTEFKQGGYMNDACANWRLDPGENGSDY